MQFRNESFDSKALKKILAEHLAKYDLASTAEFADKIKNIGFKFFFSCSVVIRHILNLMELNPAIHSNG